LWALQKLYASDVIAVNAVGGISKNMKPGTLITPAQIIDYSFGRESTIFDGEFAPLSHIDFSFPYTERLRAELVRSAAKVDQKVINGGVYGVSQGPRLETAAEIFRMERDGCDIVGMTGMPEACLARELKLNFASLGLVVNSAAGKGASAITLKDIDDNLSAGMQRVRLILSQLVVDFYQS
jgi:5'-methylthioinosine phosphorylase